MIVSCWDKKAKQKSLFRQSTQLIEIITRKTEAWNPYVSNKNFNKNLGCKAQVVNMPEN